MLYALLTVWTITSSQKTIHWTITSSQKTIHWTITSSPKPIHYYKHPQTCAGETLIS